MFSEAFPYVGGVVGCVVSCCAARVFLYRLFGKSDAAEALHAAWRVSLCLLGGGLIGALILSGLAFGGAPGQEAAAWGNLLLLASLWFAVIEAVTLWRLGQMSAGRAVCVAIAGNAWIGFGDSNAPGSIFLGLSMWAVFLPVFILSAGITFELFKFWSDWKSYVSLTTNAALGCLLAAVLLPKDTGANPVLLGGLVLAITMSCELLLSITRKSNDKWLTIALICNLFSTIVAVGGLHFVGGNTAVMRGTTLDAFANLVTSGAAMSFLALPWLIVVKAACLRWMRWAEFSACCVDAFLSTCAAASWVCSLGADAGTLLSGLVVAPISAHAESVELASMFVGVVCVQALTLWLARGRHPLRCLLAAVCEQPLVSWHPWVSLLLLVGVLGRIKSTARFAIGLDGFQMPELLVKESIHDGQAVNRNEEHCLKAAAIHWRHRHIPNRALATALTALTSISLEGKKDDLAARFYVWWLKTKEQLQQAGCNVADLEDQVKRLEPRITRANALAAGEARFSAVPDQVLVDLMSKALGLQRQGVIQQFAGLKVILVMLIPLSIIYSLQTEALAESMSGTPQADWLFNQSLSIKRLILGTGHADVARSIKEYADSAALSGEHEKARHLYEEASVLVAPDALDRAGHAQLGDIYERLRMFKLARAHFACAWSGLQDTSDLPVAGLDRSWCASEASWCALAAGDKNRAQVWWRLHLLETATTTALANAQRLTGLADRWLGSADRDAIWCHHVLGVHWRDYADQAFREPSATTNMRYALLHQARAQFVYVMQKTGGDSSDLAQIRLHAGNMLQATDSTISEMDR